MITAEVQKGKDFFFQARTGEFADLETQVFGGQNPGVTADNEENINNVRLETGTGEIYTYLTADTTLYITSTDATDDQTIVFTGVDDEFNPILRLGTLNGQTPVALSGQMFRVQQLLMIIGPSGVNKGNVYLSTDNTDITAGVPNTLSKVKGKIDANAGQGNLGTFTVPKDKNGYMYSLEIASSKVSDLDLFFRFRFPDATGFTNGPPFQIFQSGVLFFNRIGFVLPEGSDVDFTIKSPTARSKLTLQLSVILL